MSIRSVGDRLRRPEYTGENRCLPCTVVNVCLTVVAAAAATVALGPPGGLAVLAVGLGAIYFRGYLVPGTPTLTVRYFPPWLLELFGKDLELRETLVPLEGVAVRATAEGGRLIDSFAADWDDRIERMRDAGVSDDDVATLLGVEEASSVSGDVAYVVDGGLRRWLSESALLADAAAAAVLDARGGEAWDALDPDEFSDPGPETIRMLIATSMISHGVDQPVLNFIAFFGLPRDTAEYIQSYSRVGRKWPGTVVVLHDPMRTRDRGYYRQFQHHQAYQDLLVESTPLERWAEYAIECTMPGIFAAALLQYYDYHLEDVLDDRLYLFNGFEEATQAGHVEYDDLYRFIRKAYGLPADPAEDSAGFSRPSGSSDSSTGMRIYERKIEDEFQTVWEAYRKDDNKVPDEVANNWEMDESNFLSSVLERDDDSRTPMRSLRDIDEQILVKLDSETSSVINGYRQ